LLQVSDLLHFEDLDAILKEVGPEPVRNFIEGNGGLFLDNELVVPSFEHS
jgi:hypothetical protein